MGYSVVSFEKEINRIIDAQKEEESIWTTISESKDKPRGTSIPALYSVFYKFIQNPSTVSVDTFKRMIDTDETFGAGVDFLTTALASRLGKYQHKSQEITERVNNMLDGIDGGWYNKVKEMLSACWAGFYVGEKVWANTENGWVIDRIVALPPSSILFEVDYEGRIEPDGILQYQRNVNPWGTNQNFNFMGGLFSSGFTMSGGLPFGSLKVDPFAKMGDMTYPIRNANSFMYLSVRIPRDKCVHFAFDSQGKMGNPYGRSILRRGFNAYVAKAQIVQMMLRALDRKGTPLLIVYAAPNATVRDPQKANTASNRGRNVGMDAARSVSQVMGNIHNDSVVTLPGKKGQIYEVDSIPMDANADQFIEAIQYFDRAALRAMLIPSLVFSSGDGSGSFALGQEHSKTWDKICDGYLEGLKQTAISQVVEPYLMYNFPESAWRKDGLGSFMKRDLTQDERDKETDNIEKAVNMGILDLTDLNDYNTAREKFGFEAKDTVPESVSNPAEELDEDGSPVEGEEDEPEPKKD